MNRSQVNDLLANYGIEGKFVLIAIFNGNWIAWDSTSQKLYSFPPGNLLNFANNATRIPGNSILYLKNAQVLSEGLLGAIVNLNGD